MLEELRSSPWHGPQARAGIELARALNGESEHGRQSAGEPLAVPESEGPKSLDPSAFPVPLIIRTAFERGEFSAALRLTELAERLGVRTVPLLTVASWIEGGKTATAHAFDGLDLEVPGVVAQRLAHHLASPEEQGGILLRDRHGTPIGTAHGDELDLVQHVRPELVPRAVAAAGHDHPGAGSLRLTLDLELSGAAFHAFGRYRGSIVILDPHSGEILAAVSDRRTWRQGGTAAFEQLREPASIAKLITTTAALRAGYEPDSEMRRMYCRGHESYSGQLLYCPTIVGRLRNLDRAMATSCNVAFANLGVRVGRQGMLDEFRRYGFDQTDHPLAGARIVQARGDDRQLADLSIGLEATAITPLHAALLAATVANDGVMPEPRLVAAVDGRLGLHPRPVPMTTGQRVIESQWVPEIQGAMEAVVEAGTAQKVWPPRNFPVAMKTGTASDPRYGFHVNYIGYGPRHDARLAFCVRITDRPTSNKVRYAARQVTYQLLRNLARVAEDRDWVERPGRRHQERRSKTLIASQPVPRANGSSRPTATR